MTAERRLTVPWVLLLRVNDDAAAQKVLARLEARCQDHFEVERAEQHREDKGLLRVHASTIVEAEGFHDAVIAVLALAFRIGHQWTMGGGLLLQDGERASDGGIYEHVWGIADHSLMVSGVESVRFEVERVDDEN